MTIRKAERIAKAIAVAFAATMVTCSAAYAVAQLAATHVIINEPPHRVAAGETVWTISSEIANRHADKQINVGALAYAIEKENNVKNSSIKPGQVLIIPDSITF